jgi:signal peptidase I
LHNLNVMKINSFLRELLISAIIGFALFLVLQNTIQTCIVSSSSMEPDLTVGQRLIVSKITYRFYAPKRGDIIVFQPPANPGAIPYIKRVIGLPGDIVEIKDGKVLINGNALFEPYIKETPSYYMPPEDIPAESYFVLGDNRNDSNDSHVWGTVPRDNIIGKASFTIWPLGEWGTAPNYNFN